MFLVFRFQIPHFPFQFLVLHFQILHLNFQSPYHRVLLSQHLSQIGCFFFRLVPLLRNPKQCEFHFLVHFLFNKVSLSLNGKRGYGIENLRVFLTVLIKFLAQLVDLLFYPFSFLLVLSCVHDRIVVVLVYLRLYLLSH